MFNSHAVNKPIFDYVTHNQQRRKGAVLARHAATALRGAYHSRRGIRMNVKVKT